MPMFQAGEAFINAEAPGVPAHLWIAISDPAQDATQILLVNVSSAVSSIYYEDSCTLSVGEHPFIQRPSYIVYSRAKAPSEQQLSNLLAQGLLKHQPPATDALLRKIRRGAAITSELELRFLALLKRQGLL